MSKTPDNVLKKIEEAKRNKSTELNLGDCGLTQFPQEILELTNLTELDLINNQLTTVPEVIGKMALTACLSLKKS